VSRGRPDSPIRSAIGAITLAKGYVQNFWPPA
jgi:hypothetical protein